MRLLLTSDRLNGHCCLFEYKKENQNQLMGDVLQNSCYVTAKTFEKIHAGVFRYIFLDTWFLDTFRYCIKRQFLPCVFFSAYTKEYKVQYI